MKKFTDVILISDYDGTFTSQIRENYKKNVAAVERLKNGGGIFTFATGRDYHSLLAIEPDFENIANAPVITANGARLYDIDKKDFTVNITLNMALFAGFLDIIYKKFPDIGVRFSCEGGMVAPVLNDIIKADLNDIFTRHLPVREMSVSELIASGESVYKCVMVHEPEIIDAVIKLARDFNNINNNQIFFSRTYLRGFEAIDKNASKKSMAIKLKEYLSAKNNRKYRLFAIGDYDNDLGMIQIADCGAAPANALEEVKKAAKVRTVGNIDGAVADFIKIIEREYV